MWLLSLTFIKSIAIPVTPVKTMKSMETLQNYSTCIASKI